jgi:hypothetical protein
MLCPQSSNASHAFRVIEEICEILNDERGQGDPDRQLARRVRALLSDDTSRAYRFLDEVVGIIVAEHSAPKAAETSTGA